MAKKVAIGGERVGSGNKMNVDVREFGYSSFDTSRVHRFNASAGTLIPTLVKPLLPGQIETINLDMLVMSNPTLGLMYSSEKLQIDVFTAPIRLYQAKLHNNTTGIGRNMATVKLPQIGLTGNQLDVSKQLEGQHTATDSAFWYLGIKGLGCQSNDLPDDVPLYREFDATGWLMMTDVYKTYYANKQEEIGMVIHGGVTSSSALVNSVTTNGQNVPKDDISGTAIIMGDEMRVKYESGTLIFPANIEIYDTSQGNWQAVTAFYSDFEHNELEIRYYGLTDPGNTIQAWRWTGTDTVVKDPSPRIRSFELSDVDKMRELILSKVSQADAVLFDGTTGIELYDLPFEKYEEIGEPTIYSATSTQEGLLLKTYQSDIFNNVLNKEAIDGSNGVNEVTAVSIVNNKLDVSALIMAQKVFNMFNRIQVADDTYQSWQDMTYDVKGNWATTSPIYWGGLSKEFVYDPVVSNSQTADQPLGTLAGRGMMSGKHKGGHVRIKVTEMSYLMVIFSITPRIDYYQGNEWFVNLKTMNDFHKPDLDGIGFQDVVTDTMAFWDTTVDNNGLTTFYSIGKTTAWQYYQTSWNTLSGDFALKDNKMFMVNARRYESGINGKPATIMNPSSYIEPMMWNYKFADTEITAKNWDVQVSHEITSRMKMGYRQLPKA